MPRLRAQQRGPRFLAQTHFRAAPGGGSGRLRFEERIHQEERADPPEQARPRARRGLVDVELNELLRGEPERSAARARHRLRGRVRVVHDAEPARARDSLPDDEIERFTRGVDPLSEQQPKEALGRTQPVCASTRKPQTRGGGQGLLVLSQLGGKACRAAGDSVARDERDAKLWVGDRPLDLCPCGGARGSARLSPGSWRREGAGRGGARTRTQPWTCPFARAVVDCGGRASRSTSSVSVRPTLLGGGRAF